MGCKLTEQAIALVPGFNGMNRIIRQKMLITGYERSTIHSYMRELARTSLHFRALPQTQSADSINKYLADLFEKYAGHQGTFKLSIWSLRYYFKTIRREDICLALPKSKRQPALPAVLSGQEVRRLFETADDFRHRLMLMTMYSAGLRAGELCRLKISDIDPDRLRIHVRRSKFGKDRYVVLSTYLLRQLRKYLKKYRPVDFLFNGHKKGSRLSREGLRHLFRKYVVKAGIIKHVTLHSLRHSFATHLLEQGLDLFSIKEQMGHSRIATTMMYIRIAQVLPKVAFSPLDRIYRQGRATKQRNAKKKIRFEPWGV